MLGGLASDGNVEEGLEVSYLYWESESFEPSIVRRVLTSCTDAAFFSFSLFLIAL